MQERIEDPPNRQVRLRYSTAEFCTIPDPYDLLFEGSKILVVPRCSSQKNRMGDRVQEIPTISCLPPHVVHEPQAELFHFVNHEIERCEIIKRGYGVDLHRHVI